MSPEPASVYVVDDDPSFRRALARLLRALGLRPVAFASAQAMMQEPEHLRADCFIIDIHLDGGNGFHLLDLLAEEGHEAPAVLITGSVDEALRERARRSTAIDLLVKPFEDQQLIETLRKALGEERWPDGVPD